MAWKRESDTIAFDPRVLDVVEHPQADPRSVNEVWGFFSRMAAMTAQHATDYVVTYPVALALAGNDHAELERLWSQCAFAGLGDEITLENGRRGFRLVNDPEFVHMKTADEIAFEAQRKRDNSDTHMTVRIRMRDGDACRYCGLVVWFSMRRGDKRGTYDHRPPGQPGSAETSVVACGACNSGRGALSRELEPEEGLAAADARYPLLAPPPQPYWSPSTREWLAGHAQVLSQYGLTPPPAAHPNEKPLRAGSPAPGAAAPAPRGDERPATGDPARSATSAGAERPTRPARPGPAASKSGRNQQDRSLLDPDPPGRVGAGRDGPGREGVGSEPPAAVPPTDRGSPARRRGRRGGRRNRNTGGNR
jgi:hypothetical protein